MLWREFVELAPDLPVARSVSMGMGHGSRISKKELAGYEAPFPDGYYKAAAIALPLSLPVRADDPGAAEMRRTRDGLAAWHKPALVLFSDDDLLFSRQYNYFRSLIPSAKHQPETIVRDAGHFLHEERGQEVAGHILDFVARTPGSSMAEAPHDAGKPEKSFGVTA
jgi:haloalkane dehalogenase